MTALDEDDPDPVSELLVGIEPAVDTDVEAMVRALRVEDSRSFVSERTLDHDVFVIAPKCLMTRKRPTS